MTDILLSRATVLRGKLEPSYAGDVSPTLADDVFEVSNVSFKRREGSRPGRESADPYFGHKGELPAVQYQTLGFAVDVAPSSQPGSAPAIDPILQSCGFAAVVNSGSDVTYNPIQKQIKSMAWWLHLSGHLHKMIGCRGSLSLSGEMGGMVKAEVNYQGLIGPDPSDETFPAVARPSACYPVMDKDNGSVSVFGTNLDLVSFKIDFGLQITHLLTSERNEMVISDRAVTAELTVLKPAISAFNYHDLEGKPCDTGALELQTPAFTATSQAASMGVITDGGDHNGAATITIPLMLHRVNGNDDILLKFS